MTNPSVHPKTGIARQTRAGWKWFLRRNPFLAQLSERFYRRNAPGISFRQRLVEWIYGVALIGACIFILESFHNEAPQNRSPFDILVAIVCLLLGTWIFLFGFQKHRPR